MPILYHPYYKCNFLENTLLKSVVNNCGII